MENHMGNENQVLEIPYGTRDYLPGEATGKRAIETQLARLFALWGYDEVVTPTIEYLDTLTMDSGRTLTPQLFKLFDKGGRTLALRHEMTTPIARVVGSRLKDAPLPLKLSYISSVFRSEQSQMGRQCEFYQAGVELVGSASAAADAEVLALAIQSLLRSGLKSFQVCLGQVEFAAGIMEQYRLSEADQQALKDALEQHDLVAYDAAVEALPLAAQAKKNLRQLPVLSGGEDVLTKAYSLALGEKSRRALDNLSAVYRLLASYGVDRFVRFDLGLIRDFSYYTGLVFEVYTAGLGYPLAGGGRYDHMLSDFGCACPATGFALGIERVLLALERQGIGAPAAHKDVFVAYAAGKEEEAVNRASSLRSEGKVAELALVPMTKADAAHAQTEKGYAALVYLG
ncbi:ATP phosphoribosyltransferase regulatory subunit [Selenomonas sp.]|uniref:ATP phosphoribosyltransferase regulatory subunit n=2 Tax=Selenomonas sp. TaxID=2053611 RepID=UPI0025E73191|nr:ATP phosphoribosyltransferase regulatory subunit [Selenomonas sp.]